MARKDRTVLKNVTLSRLRGDMTILEYSKFSDRYELMDKKTCTFVKHNFQGTRAEIIRDGEKVKIRIENVKQGDTLKKILDSGSALESFYFGNEKN